MSTSQHTSNNTSHLPQFKESLPFDIPASIVVFLIAVPLCLGIALASEAPLISGIVAGIVGGIVVALISGSQLSVSGPAAGLAVVVAHAITTLGSFEAFLAAVVLAGAFQLVFAILKLGVIGEYVPNCVIKGMLAGIGIVIILKQLPHALGYHGDFQGDTGFNQPTDGENTFSSILRGLNMLHPGASLISLCSLAIIFLWEHPAIKNSKLKLFLPAQLVVVVFGAACAVICNSVLGDPFTISEAHAQFVALPIFSTPIEFFSKLPSPELNALWSRATWGVAMTIAVVASIESLLSVEASDKLDPFRRISSTNRELFAQGAGNIVSGLLGGLPVTAVIVRSSANIYAGARTKTSGFLHGILILIAVLLIPGLLNKIPLACLAAILIAVGYKLAHPSLFYQMYKDGASQYVPFVLTILGIVFTDLLTGVLLGMVLGLYFVVKTNHHDALTIVHEESNYLVRLNKDLSFINKAELKDALETIPDNTTVMLDGTKSMFIDHDIYDIVKDFKAQSHHRGITVSEKNMTSKNLPLKFRKD